MLEFMVPKHLEKSTTGGCEWCRSPSQTHVVAMCSSNWNLVAPLPHAADLSSSPHHLPPSFTSLIPPPLKANHCVHSSLYMLGRGRRQNSVIFVFPQCAVKQHGVLTKMLNLQVISLLSPTWESCRADSIMVKCLPDRLA